MAHKFRTLVLTEELGFIPSPHMVAQKHPWLQFQWIQLLPLVSEGTGPTCGTQTYMWAKHWHIKINSISSETIPVPSRPAAYLSIYCYLFSSSMSSSNSVYFSAQKWQILVMYLNKQMNNKIKEERQEEVKWQRFPYYKRQKEPT